jgi:chorismate dehydratase
LVADNPVELFRIRTIRGYLCASKVTDLKKIRVAAVSYLNTKPLLHGIRRHSVMKDIELVEDYPARIAQMLIEDQVDIGLIPVAATTRLPEWHLVGDTCIGCDGAVASVCLFSEVPMDKIETVLLDYQSRTSVNLARILLKEYWKKEVKLVAASGEDYRKDIRGTAAGVVIGDRALEQRLRSTYIYDLGEAWKEHTGLPFVFAAWIANKKLPEEFQKLFNEANKEGLQHLHDVVKANPFPAFDLREYYTKCIRYQLNADMREGLSLFLKKLGETR